MLKFVKSNIKKAVLIFLSFLLLFNSLAQPAAALAQDSTWYNQSFEDWFVKVYDDGTSPPNEIFGERYTAAQVQWVVYSLASLPFLGGSTVTADAVICGLRGDLSACSETLQNFIRQTLNPIGQKNKDSGLIAVFTQNPASGIKYINSLTNKFRLVPEVKAQGFGYTASDLAREIWKATRNIAYGLMIVATIIIAFMVMFQVKISPQVIITAQSAIPKIIIGIILVTFSYAIAGFAIDLMYVVIGLLSTMLTSSGLSEHDAITLFNSFIEKDVFWSFMQYWVLFLPISLISLKVWSALGIGAIVIIFWIIMLFILLWFTLKTIFMMIKTFVNIFFAVIMAPLQILVGVVVQGWGFGPWLKGLFSNLVVYPTVGLMFFLAFFFLRQAVPADWSWVNDVFPFDVIYMGGGNSWQPPFTFGTSNNPISGGVDILFVAISFVIITLIPKTVELIQGFISGKPLAFGTGISESNQQLKTIGEYAGQYERAYGPGGPAAAPSTFIQGLVRLTKWLALMPK